MQVHQGYWLMMSRALEDSNASLCSTTLTVELILNYTTATDIRKRPQIITAKPLENLTSIMLSHKV